MPDSGNIAFQFLFKDERVKWTARELLYDTLYIHANHMNEPILPGSVHFQISLTELFRESVCICCQSEQNRTT